jgi:hypothetical protein
MAEPATAGEPRVPAAIQAAITAFAPVIAPLFAAMLVKSAVPVSKIMLRKLAAEPTVTEVHSAKPHRAVSATVPAAAARSGIDLSQSEPEHNSSPGRDGFSKKHPTARRMRARDTNYRPARG